MNLSPHVQSLLSGDHHLRAVGRFACPCDPGSCALQGPMLLVGTPTANWSLCSHIQLAAWCRQRERHLPRCQTVSSLFQTGTSSLARPCALHGWWRTPPEISFMENPATPQTCDFLCGTDPMLLQDRGCLTLHYYIQSQCWWGTVLSSGALSILLCCSGMFTTGFRWG